MDWLFNCNQLNWSRYILIWLRLKSLFCLWTCPRSGTAVCDASKPVQVLNRCERLLSSLSEWWNLGLYSWALNCFPDHLCHKNTEYDSRITIKRNCKITRDNRRSEQITTARSIRSMTQSCSGCLHYPPLDANTTPPPHVPCRELWQSFEAARMKTESTSTRPLVRNQSYTLLPAPTASLLAWYTRKETLRHKTVSWNQAWFSNEKQPCSSWLLLYVPFSTSQLIPNWLEA